MKKFILFVLSLCIVTNSFCQNNYIDTLYPNFGGLPAPSILMNDSTFLVASGSILDISSFNLGRFDLNGTLLNSKSFTNLGYWYTGSCNKCLKKRSDIYFYAQTNYVTGPNDAYVRFWKFNNSLDSIQTKKIVDPFGHIRRINALEFDSDTTFLVSGYVLRLYPTLGKRDLWVAKYDTAFNMLWEQIIPDNHPQLHEGYFGEHITIDNYGNAVISGKGYGFQRFIDTIHYSMAASFDLKNGNLNWINDYYTAPGNDYFIVLDHGDGTYRYIQKQYLRMSAGFPILNTMHFGAMDTLGNMLWNTSIGPQYNLINIRDMQKTYDGNYYISGERISFPWYRFSYGFKVSPRGDSIWFRDYQHKTDSSNVSYLWSFQQTPDSGFVHFGLYGDENNNIHPVRIQYSWLLKTDKYGCAQKDCHTIGIPEFHKPFFTASIFPNPNHGTFNLRLSDKEPVRNYTVDVFNISGQKVYTTSVDQVDNTITIPFAKPGLYLVKILSAGVLFHHQKIIVN